MPLAENDHIIADEWQKFKSQIRYVYKYNRKRAVGGVVYDNCPNWHYIIYKLGFILSL
jgi:hypothetical protein